MHSFPPDLHGVYCLFQFYSNPLCKNPVFFGPQKMWKNHQPASTNFEEKMTSDTILPDSAYFWTSLWISSPKTVNFLTRFKLSFPTFSTFFQRFRPFSIIFRQILLTIRLCFYLLCSGYYFSSLFPELSPVLYSSLRSFQAFFRLFNFIFYLSISFSTLFSWMYRGSVGKVL